MESILAVVLVLAITSIPGSEPAYQEHNEGAVFQSRINPGETIVNLELAGAHISASQPAYHGFLYERTLARVIPEEGFQSRIKLGGTIVKLVQHGVIERQKLENLYAGRGGLPQELRTVLTAPSGEPIRLTQQNAHIYVNLLWPLGLANYMSSNLHSPINKLTPIKGRSLYDFASTSGWNLGKEPEGGVYFNKLRIVDLTPEQEALVVKIAKSSYRPCCDNPTFFQDCNHGSALLGLLQLGASQGLSEDELYREALAFNSFWFPRNYVYNALYMLVMKAKDWTAVDAKALMGREFSSASASAKVQAEVEKIPNLIPKQSGEGERCSV